MPNRGMRSSGGALKGKQYGYCYGWERDKERISMKEPIRVLHVLGGLSLVKTHLLPNVRFVAKTVRYPAKSNLPQRLQRIPVIRVGRRHKNIRFYPMRRFGWTTLRRGWIGKNSMISKSFWMNMG